MSKSIYEGNIYRDVFFQMDLPQRVTNGPDCVLLLWFNFRGVEFNSFDMKYKLSEQLKFNRK